MVFGRLFTRSPLDNPREKAWTEVRMQWLSEQFGVQPLRNCEVLLPTDESMPEAAADSIPATKPLLERLCRQMQITSQGLELQDFDEGDPGEDATGLYHQNGDRAVIKINYKRVDALSIVSTLAHELGHHRLLGENRIARDDPDHENVTDLVPVYFGVGIFQANNTVRDQAYKDGLMEVFQISQSGYLASRILGYALALFAWVRGEVNPPWAAHLRKDARAVMQAGLRYLQKTNDSVFRPETAGQQQPQLSVDELVGLLKSGTPSRKIAALWDLNVLGEQARPAMDAVTRVILNDSDPVRIEALYALEAIGTPDEAAEDAVRRQLSHFHQEIRTSALAALRVVSTRLDEALPDFIFALEDMKPAVVMQAAQILAECGDLAAEAGPSLLRPLHRGIVRHDDGVIRACLQTLIAIGADADALIAEHFQDPELLQQARDYLRELL